MSNFDTDWNALREMQDEQLAGGDGRRCSRHPDVVIGSPCGQFDGTCPKCEQAADDAETEAEWRNAGVFP